MSLGNRSARRRGMRMGAAISSSRSKKAQSPATNQPQVAQAPSEPVAAKPGAVEQLKQFADLRDQGILTEEEFAAKKKQILGI